MHPVEPLIDHASDQFLTIGHTQGHGIRAGLERRDAVLHPQRHFAVKPEQHRSKDCLHIKPA